MLWLAVIGREVVDAALAMPPGTVGLIPSVSQVGYDRAGYTGLDNRNLAWMVGDRLQIHRDHLGWQMPKDTVLACLECDNEAGFTSVMLDTDDPEVYRSPVLKRMNLEAGGGEHVTEMSQLKKRVIMAQAERLTPLWFSMDFGPLIRGQANRGVRGTSDITTVSRQYGSPRVHNCDYLPMAAYTELARAGAKDFNIAPQLGAIVTLTYLRLAREQGVNLDAWCNLVYSSKRWETWTQQSCCAIEAGGQYHLEQLPRDFRKLNYSLAVAQVVKFSKQVLEAINATDSH